MDDGLRDEIVALTRDLIRIDTTNGPGNETAAAVLLRDYLLRNGVPAEIVARDPARANLVARVRGTGGGRSIALLGHTDVVYADRATWTVDPFGGEVRDDHLWGRGALDMKGHTAANAVALARLARSGFRPRGDVVLIAEADEEDGAADVGMAWLLRERPDLATDFALNEGAAGRVELVDGRAAYFLAAGEKASMPVRVTAHGVAGHAAIPTSGDNALVKLATVIRRIASHGADVRLEPEIEAFLDVLVPGSAPLADRIDEARRLHRVIDSELPAMMAATISPTMTSASAKRNVIPARAELICDCRVLPGTEPDELLEEFAHLLGDLDVTFALVEPPKGGSRSPLDTPLEKAVRAELALLEPHALLVPTLCTGFTDSHYVRSAFGTVAYGFFPLRHTAPELLATVHSADERIHVADLEAGVRFIEGVVRRVAG
jgi:acetylornithine deacetylase/succinyl-diaminopimelate desuccinylase-like protein